MGTQKSLLKFPPIVLTLLLTGLSFGTLLEAVQAQPPDHAPAWGYRCRRGNQRACDHLNRDRDDDYEDEDERDYDYDYDYGYDDDYDRDYRFGRIESGTRFDVAYQGDRAVVFRQDERYPLTFYLEDDLRDNNRIVLPEGSRIAGEFRPAEDGVRFVTRRVELPNGDEYRLEAVSRVIYGDRQMTRRDDQINIITEAAQVLIGEIFGNNRDRTNDNGELIVINPSRRLALELRRDFDFDN